MKINNLIGVSGSINSGKDLVGEMLLYIAETENPTFKGFNDAGLITSAYEIKKCAEKLKEIVAIVIGCNRSDLENETFKNTPLGEEWERYALNTVYVPDPLDSSSSEIYYATNYFSDEQSAKEDLPHSMDAHGGEEYFEGSITKEILTPRKILQLLGTQGGRKEVHPNIWVNSLFSDWKPYDKGTFTQLDFDASGAYFHESCQHCDSSFMGYKRQYLCGECINDDEIQFYPKWIITDVRFPKNEGVAVTKNNGLLIGLRRKFILKFPQHYALRLGGGEDEYSIPRDLYKVDVELYKSLTHESEASMGDHSWCDVIIENNGTIEDLFDEVLKAVS